LPQLRLQVLKFDGLREKICRAILRGLPPPLVIAVSGHHHDRQFGEPLLDLTEQLQPVHAGHVDVGEDRDQRRLDFAREPIQRFRPRSRIMQDIDALAGLTAKPLPIKLGDVGFVIRDQDTGLKGPLNKTGSKAIDQQPGLAVP
jgi:hypothetical protein